MYKLLLSWRYLKTRFIALASIVSVTLGVATLIVVNSVMSGFIVEMKDRLHGILSDVELQSPGMGEIFWPDLHVKDIKEILGDEVEAVTYAVRTPAMLNFEYGGRQWTQTIYLVGIDQQTFGKVTDFNPYLMNENKKDTITFDLEDSGYDKRIGEAGWAYRREKFENKRKNDALIQAAVGSRQLVSQASFEEQLTGRGQANNDEQQFKFAPLPDTTPDITKLEERDEPLNFTAGNIPAVDPRAKFRKQVAEFDPGSQQHTGIILGMAISARPYVDENGDKQEMFMLKPGDDIRVTLPTAGNSPQPVTEKCTVVDFYSSNMHEYDSSLAFVPLERMQKIRGMIDAGSGESSVSSIQIKLKPGSDLGSARDKLIERFPPSHFSYVIQTWQDSQRPLLSAVDMEITVLNILLFMIIAVAGFGILATFYMIVVEKTKDIGILKALGAPSRGVMSIFLTYGLSLGLVGTGVGIILGLAFVYYINGIADVVQWITGQEIFDPTIYYFDAIPTIVEPMTVFWVAVGAVSIAVLASVLPALRAAKLHPVEALRYE